MSLTLSVVEIFIQTNLIKTQTKQNPEIESERNQNRNSHGKRSRFSHNEIQEAIASARKELEEIKLNIEKATSEVSYLKVATTSLRSELEQEKSSQTKTKPISSKANETKPRN
ncbi:hypothetical protein P8452_70203 [Trifolium repens]|nr:hypothetical protein P8452_70203 [Trifolium repens]